MAVSLTSQESHFALGGSAGFLFRMVDVLPTPRLHQARAMLYAREPLKSIYIRCCPSRLLRDLEFQEPKTTFWIRD